MSEKNKSQLNKPNKMLTIDTTLQQEAKTLPLQEDYNAFFVVVIVNHPKKRSLPRKKERSITVKSAKLHKMNSVFY